VISVAFKTSLEIRLGICSLYKTSLLHQPDDYIGFTPSCPHTFHNKIAPMELRNQNIAEESESGSKRTCEADFQCA